MTCVGNLSAVKPLAVDGTQAAGRPLNLAITKQIWCWLVLVTENGACRKMLERGRSKEKKGISSVADVQH